MIAPSDSFQGMNCTICTTYDCNLRCVYDLPAGTKVLMSDFSEKNIEDVKAGDQIIGFTEKPMLGKFRKFELATVEAAGPTRKLTEAYVYKYMDGRTALMASGEHPVVNQRNVFVKTKDFYESEEKEKRILKDRLPRNIKPDNFSKEYMIGYVVACWLGDGEIKGAIREIDEKNSFNRGARFVVKDQEIMDRMRQFMTALGYEYTEFPFKISEKHNLIVNAMHIRGTVVDKLNTELLVPYYGKCETSEYLKGFFAGAFDCEGSCDGVYNSYAIYNSDETYLSTICDALTELGSNDFVVKEPKNISHCTNVVTLNVYINRKSAVEMITLTNPACLRKYSEGIEKHGYYDRVPITIEKVAIPETQFYNLTTSSKTFIANGIYVHNCYEICKHKSEITMDKVYKFIDRLIEDEDPIGATGTTDAWISKTGMVMDFIGGDSFMQPEIIDKALSYLQYKLVMTDHPWKNNWRASISSNGTLFANPEVQKVIEKWNQNISIGISVDGCPAIHDKYRIFRDRNEKGEVVGTLETIMNWWGWIKERQPEACDHTKATCSKETIPYLFESLKFFHEILGMHYVSQNFIMEDTGCKEDDYVLLDEQYRKCSNYLYKHRRDLYWSMFDKQGLNKRSDNYEDFRAGIKKGWCGSGAMPSVGMSGKIYPCFRWLPHTQEDYEKQADTMVVGDVENGFNHKENFRRVKEATREKISSKYCLECEYEGTCAYCIGGCYAENHDFIRTEHICEISKLRAKHARRYWDRVEESDHPHFDYFQTDGELHFERHEDLNKKAYDGTMRYGPDGKLKPGIEMNEEEKRLKEYIDDYYYKQGHHRDTPKNFFK